MRITPWLALLPLLAHAEPPLDDMLQAHEAAALIPPFRQQLLDTVQTAMRQGGPQEAIRTCQLQAPRIAAENGRMPWTVGRTALRVRNPANAPDAWEREVLEDFAHRARQGEPLARMSRAQTVDGEFRYMQAIATAEPCLACHGKALAPEVVALLDSAYPGDQARGFAAGELRGAFSLRRPAAEVVR